VACGKNVLNGDEEDDRDQRRHPRFREQQQVGAEDSGDGTRGADRRHARGGVEERVGQRREEAAGDVEDEIAEVVEAVLDVVAEDPEVEHVAAEVQPAAVHKHRGENGDEIGTGVCGKSSGHDRPPFDERIATAQLYEKEQDVECDQ